jgi:hypothetical protein
VATAPGWCSAAEAAARLQVTTPTVINWVRKGALRGYQDDKPGPRNWHIEIDSVDEVLVERGPGARRGRPSGSVAQLQAEINHINQRLQALEAAAAGGESIASPSLTVLSRLVQLLHAEGADTAARSQRVTQATEQLAALLPSGQSRQRAVSGS